MAKDKKINKKKKKEKEGKKERKKERKRQLNKAQHPNIERDIELILGFRLMLMDLIHYHMITRPVDSEKRQLVGIVLHLFSLPSPV